jgi:hypothetical protein
MRPRTAALLAWSLWVAIFVLLALGFLFPSIHEIGVILLPIAASFATVGAFVASRRPANPIGWMFVAFGAVAALRFFGEQYATYALETRPGSLPAGSLVASLAVHLWHPGFAFFVFSFLLFPHGRLLSPRWRPVAWITAANGVVGVISGMLEYDFLRDPANDMPFARPLVVGPVADVAAVVFGVFLMVNLVTLAASGLSLVLRLRRSRGDERQQLKWLVYTVVLVVFLLPTSLLLVGDGSLGALMLPLIPISVGIAILKYRLYDIDLIVNRTLVYGSLTATLVLVYIGSVVLLQYVFRTVTGGDSQFAIVASTLVIAALFGPLRRRVQAFIDRRFYRRKYDAAKTLAQFSTKLRDETDLKALREDLLSVVRETMQPAHASLWLREPRAERKLKADG